MAHVVPCMEGFSFAMYSPHSEQHLRFECGCLHVSRRILIFVWSFLFSHHISHVSRLELFSIVVSIFLLFISVTRRRRLRHKYSIFILPSAICNTPNVPENTSVQSTPESNVKEGSEVSVVLCDVECLGPDNPSNEWTRTLIRFRFAKEFEMNRPEECNGGRGCGRRNGARATTQSEKVFQAKMHKLSGVWT